MKFKLFSLFGLLTIIAICYFFYSFIQQNSQINGLYNQAIFGLIKQEYVFVQGTNFTLLIGAVFAAIYLLVVAVYISLYRVFLFKQPLKILQEGRKVVVTFPNNKFQGFLFVLAELVVYSDSALNELLPAQQIVGVMKRNSIIFDLSEVPSGRYSVRMLKFYIRDQLGLFDAPMFRDEVSIVLLLAPTAPPDITAVRQLTFTDDSILAQFAQDANDNFFASREYRRGDPLKRINWKLTAKRQNLMVRVAEDKPLKNSVLNIVLNLYLPGAVVNQTVLLGRFLDAAFSAIDVLVEMPFESVNLLINGGGDQQLNEMATYNREKIHGVILNTLKAQSKVNLNAFLQEKQLVDPLVLTLSTDLPDNNYSKVVVFRASPYLDGGMTSRLNDIFSSQQTGLQFTTLSERLSKLNPATHWQQRLSRGQLVKLAERNEKNLNQDWKLFKDEK